MIIIVIYIKVYVPPLTSGGKNNGLDFANEQDFSVIYNQCSVLSLYLFFSMHPIDDYC